MNARIHLAALLAATVLAAAPSQAAPFERSQVPADAVWFVHVDMQRFKQTQVGQYMMGLLSTPEAQDKFAAFQAVFNFDPRLSLRSCTLYSRGLAPSDAVLLLQGDFDANRLVTLAKGGEGYQSTTHRNYPVHSWLERGRHARANGSPRSCGAIHPSGLVVLGRSESRVAEALDVLDRLQPSLERAPQFADWRSSPATACLLAAARRAEGMEFDPKAAFLRHCTFYSLAAGEIEGRLFLETSLTTTDEETARNVLAINQGFKGLLALQGNRPALAKLAEGTELAQHGNQVQISIQLAATEVVEALRDAVARQAARRGGAAR